jgi:hypothetical protein
MIRFSLDEEQFLALCAGRTVRVEGAEFHLKDIGWDRMMGCARDATLRNERIPCDPGCSEQKGHGGPCR